MVCFASVSTAIEDVLAEAQSGGWMARVDGIIADSGPQSPLALDCALMLKGVGTRGGAGVVIPIPTAALYLNAKTGQVASREHSDQLTRQVLQRVIHGRQGHSISNHVVRTAGMAVRQTHFLLQYFVPELKAYEMRQYYVHCRPVRTIAAPGFVDSLAEVSELSAAASATFPLTKDHVVVAALEAQGLFQRLSDRTLQVLQQWEPAVEGERLELISRSVVTRVDMGVTVRRFHKRLDLTSFLLHAQQHNIIHAEVTVQVGAPAVACLFVNEVSCAHIAHATRSASAAACADSCVFLCVLGVCR
jgi:hypothetical protein